MLPLKSRLTLFLVFTLLNKLGINYLYQNQRIYDFFFFFATNTKNKSFTTTANPSIHHHMSKPTDILQANHKSNFCNHSNPSSTKNHRSFNSTLKLTTTTSNQINQSKSILITHKTKKTN